LSDLHSGNAIGFLFRHFLFSPKRELARFQTKQKTALFFLCCTMYQWILNPPEISPEKVDHLRILREMNYFDLYN